MHSLRDPLRLSQRRGGLTWVIFWTARDAPTYKQVWSGCRLDPIDGSMSSFLGVAGDHKVTPNTNLIFHVSGTDGDGTISRRSTFSFGLQSGGIPE